MIRSENERELVLQREMPFARELVWKVITEAEHVNRWWGPDGFRNEGVTMDFRVGGAWTFEMVGPDGTRYPNHSVFKEITPPSRLVYDHGDGERIWFEASIVVKTKCVTGHSARLPLDRCREMTLLPSRPTKEKCQLAASERKYVNSQH